MSENSSQCGCTPLPKPAKAQRRVIEVQFLELDMTLIDSSSCNTCLSVEDQIHQLLAELQPVLRRVDTDIKFEKTLVTDVEQAQTLRFKASPTIRIGGFDMIPTKGDLLGLGERYWEWEGVLYPSPPAALFIDAVLRAYVDSHAMADTTTDPYHMPENLKDFFAKLSGSSKSGGCDCSSPTRVNPTA
ncbi:DUF2703 domain-containing protein [Paenibacillus sp. 1P07SE]|uniref:DUF2703 domain-containing protein n=1 Tax=Paenibacillus sp. 1P07SE TaxID=3132209 RepID=UPI0039A5E021